jgi:hypothetical protein
MALLNPSFEDEGAAPGLAEHWTLVTSVAGERIAGFGPEPEEAWEGFERWFELLLDFAPGSLAIGFFDSHAEGYEDFEDGWSNDLFLTELPSGQVVAAPFGGGVVEDMETGWSNVPSWWSWADVAASTAVFDGEPREDFEDGWRSNQSFAWAWSSITSQRAYFDGGTDAEEDFENGWTLAATL